MRCVVLVAFLVAVHAAAAAAHLPAPHIIWDLPEAMAFIRKADQAYVVPVTCTEKRRRLEISGTDIVLTPHGDYKRARLLGSEATRKLQRLLGKQSSWFHGQDSTFGIGPEPKNVGYIFRKGKDKLVLLGYMRWRFEGTFDGAPIFGSLEEKASDKLDEWKTLYAKPELTIK